MAKKSIKKIIGIYCHQLQKEGLTLEEIGSVIQKSHAAVKYHIDKHQDYMGIYPSYVIETQSFDKNMLPKHFINREKKVKLQKEYLQKIKNENII